MKTLLLSICLLLAACATQPPVPPKEPSPPSQPPKHEWKDFFRILEQIQS